MIPDAVIQEVKDRVDSLAVLGRHLQLRRSGSGFVASCPFHEDRSPSLRVYPDGRFHCFGCGAHGDVFGFLQRMSGKPFPVIVRELASEVGLDVLADAPVHPAGVERADAVTACDAAQRHFEATLWSAAGEPGRKYLQARGVSEQTARMYRLGFADGRLAGVVRPGEHALARGLLASGLLEHARGELQDRFSGRVMLPLVGSDGRVVGFTGRAVAAGAEPLYLTTRETGAFRGSRSFFGLEEAAPAVRKGGVGLLVSGYFDVLAAREAGIINAFAVGSLSTWHIGALRRRGVREVERLLPALERFEPPPELAATVFATLAMLRVVRLPADTASAEVLLRTRGRAALDRFSGAGVPLSEYLIDEALRLHGGAAVPFAAVEAKLAAVTWLARYVRAVPRGLERSIFERRVAQRLHLPLRNVRSAVKEVNAAEAKPAQPRQRRSSTRRAY